MKEEDGEGVCPPFPINFSSLAPLTKGPRTGCPNNILICTADQRPHASTVFTSDKKSHRFIFLSPLWALKNLPADARDASSLNSNMAAQGRLNPINCSEKCFAQ